MAMIEASAANKIASRLRQAFAIRESGVFLALVVFFVAAAILAPPFRTPFNLTIILRQITVATVVGTGQTLIIISGAFDLSQGSVAGLAAMLMAISWKQWGFLPGVAIGFGLSVGVMCGFANGVLAARLRLNPIVMTLGTGTVYLGLNYWFAQGDPVTGLPASMLWIGQGRLGPIPAPVLIMLMAVVLMQVMLTRTVLGLRIQMIGGNLNSAYAVGINIDRIRIVAFTLSGFLAALGGIVIVGRTGNAIPTIGQDILFPVVTATVVGGTLLSGGVGSMAGTLMGAGIVGIVRNSIVLLQANIYLQDVIQGLLVLIALIIDQFRRGQLTWRMVLGKDRYS